MAKGPHLDGVSFHAIRVYYIQILINKALLNKHSLSTLPYNFTTNKLGPGVDQDYGQLSLKLYLESICFIVIERVVGVSHVGVINWVKKYGKALKRLSKPRGKLSAIERKAER